MRGIGLTLLVLALALPAAAVAQDVPPGNSGIDQYQESIPGVGGNRPTGGSGSGGSGGSGTASTGGSVSGSEQSRISPSTVRKLDKQGADGKATAAAAAATAPAPTPARDLGSSNDSAPGMGWVLPVILALTLAGALAVALMRRRGAPPGPA
jgi:phage tail tape-measure protein